MKKWSSPDSNQDSNNACGPLKWLFSPWSHNTYNTYNKMRHSWLSQMGSPASIWVWEWYCQMPREAQTAAQCLSDFQGLTCIIKAPSVIASKDQSLKKKESYIKHKGTIAFLFRNRGKLRSWGFTQWSSLHGEDPDPIPTSQTHYHILATTSKEGC